MCTQYLDLLANNGSSTCIKAQKILRIDKVEAAQMNEDLMQAFHDALQRDPAADLLLVVEVTFLGAHRRAQYQELSETGRYNLEP
ncbi:hypothetical protein ACJ72_02451 [Emergomyces africanus]|uniref:Uncharacterized protein n=1 Tax=Emergomyces africanus TaxID=1955775 RepID=A0A1B7P2E6_9EURO|nr:hypothetical protein ACJ72_02451 [Emergomyces africanus]